MKHFFLIIFVFISFYVQAEPKVPPPLTLNPVGSPISLFLSNYTGKWIILLEDDTCWEICILKDKCKQTWTEWLYQITPLECFLDANFFFSPGNWNESHCIQVHEASWNLKGCNYVLENLTMNEKAFARLISPHDLKIPKLSFIHEFFKNPLDGEKAIALNLQEIDNLFILNDNSIWKPIPVYLNLDSIESWFTGVPVDSSDPAFLFQTSTWQKDEIIKTFFLDHHINGKSFRVYLIENCTRHQFVFAIPISTIEFSELYKEYSESERSLGYKKGYSDGYDVGYRHGSR